MARGGGNRAVRSARRDGMKYAATPRCCPIMYNDLMHSSEPRRGERIQSGVERVARNPRTNECNRLSPGGAVIAPCGLHGAGMQAPPAGGRGNV